MYMTRKHVDRTWEQTFTATQIVRGEPEASLFAIPPPYRLISGPPVAQSAWESNGLRPYRVGGGVSPPKVIHAVNPKYTDQARAANSKGICVVSLIVSGTGIPEDVKVVRSAGTGLDEEAVKEVSQYRFSPAMYQGKAVPVQVNIDINFQQ
jgi:TonB family protein